MLRIGHRGAAGYEPENTLLSIKKALELNSDMIELDVHACNSGELVVIHDFKVDRTTNGKGFISHKTIEELNKLDAGKKERIPTLEKALDSIDRKVKVNIELKGENTAKPTYELMIEYVSKKDWDYNDFLISSSNLKELKKFSEFNLPVKKGLIITKKSIGPIGSLFKIPIGFIKLARSINPYSVHFHKRFARKKFIDEAHKEGFKVFIWTVNKSSDIDKFKLLKVDGIISDYPDKI